MLNGPNFYDPKRKQVFTAKTLEIMGYAATEDQLKAAGFIPIYYELPDCDKRFYTTTPKGNFHSLKSMTMQEDGSYIQQNSVIELPIENARQNLITLLGPARYNKEVAGCEITGIEGLTEFATNRETRTKIAELVTAGGAVDYKLDSGDFIHLTATQVKSLYKQINSYVQAAYTRESELITAINAAETVEDLAALDLSF